MLGLLMLGLLPRLGLRPIDDIASAMALGGPARAWGEGERSMNDRSDIAAVGKVEVDA